jgi:hypothetical protein
VPILTVWTLRAALSYLGVGFTLGAMMLAARGLRGASALLRYRPLHAELLLVGWLIQLAFGVAYWILPRRPGSARGGERLAWGALLLLNLGIWTVGLGATFDASAGLLVAGRSAELLAAVLFATHAWPRIRAYSLKSNVRP